MDVTVIGKGSPFTMVVNCISAVPREEMRFSATHGMVMFTVKVRCDLDRGLLVACRWRFHGSRYMQSRSTCR